MTLLRYRDLWVQRGRRELLREINLELRAGEIIALVGPNGAGKTTLLHTALGLVAPTRGYATLDDLDVRGMAPRQRAARVAWLPQILVANEPLKVHEAVATGRYRFGEAPRQSRGAALDALKRLDAVHLADRNVLQLSGGERQRVALATVIAQQSPLALLDEPANHLDPTQQIETYQLIGKLWQEGLGLLLVTHDVNLLSVLPNHEAVRVVGLRQGAVVLTSALDDRSLPNQLSDLFGMQMQALEHEGRRVIVPWPRAEGER
jgi:iron complex transport system ATP-binding protein